MDADDAQDFLTEKKQEITLKIESFTESLCIDDERQLNYELDQIVKDTESFLTYLKGLDRSEIENMENLLQSEPDFDSMPGGHDWVE